MNKQADKISKFDKLFSLVASNMKPVNTESWIGYFHGDWKFNLRRYDGDLDNVKENIRIALKLPEVGSIESILQETVNEGKYFIPQLGTCHYDDLEDPGEYEQKRIVLGILSGMLVETLLSKQENSVLVLDDKRSSSYYCAANLSHLIKIPFYEGLGVKHKGTEKALIFQLDFEEDEVVRFYPFCKCENLRLVYCSADDPLNDGSKNCDAVKLKIDHYKKVVRTIVAGNATGIEKNNLIQEIRQMPATKYK